MCVNQQFFLPENLRGELCKSGMHLAICGMMWEAVRADGGVVGQHTGRLAGETGSFSEIALRCRSWWGKTTTLFMQSEGYREGGSFRVALACPAGFCGGWALCRMLRHWSMSPPQQQLPSLCGHHWQSRLSSGAKSLFPKVVIWHLVVCLSGDSVGYGIRDCELASFKHNVCLAS